MVDGLFEAEDGLAGSVLGALRPEGAQVLDGGSWTMPTLAGGRLFLRNQTEMVSLDLVGALR